MFNWIKNHKLIILLSLALIYFALLQPNLRSARVVNTSISDFSSPASPSFGQSAMTLGSVGKIVGTPRNESVDISVANSQRRVVTETSLSLLVKDVRSTIEATKMLATNQGGFMVNSTLSSPEDATTGSLVVRVPSKKLNEFLEQTRNLAVRVVSENISGQDVTDQYKDISSRLLVLEQTKNTFEGILQRATTVEEILRVQQSIFSIQDQIDSLKGQQKYLENTSESTLVSLYMSTDELSLPYAPSAPWRPEVVFKTATRSLLLSLRSLGSLVIWLGVYSIIWIPGLVVILLIYKRNQKKNKTKQV